MKTIDVREQPRLSVGRTFEICINGVRYRLFRSVVTVMVIAVAIAFMMNILCEALSTQAVSGAARRRTEQQRLAAFWSTRLSAVPTPETILAEIAQETRDARDPVGSPLLREAQHLGGLDDATFATYARQAEAADSYLTFFKELSATNYAKVRALVGGTTGTAIFTLLQAPEARATFEANLKAVKLRLPGAPGAFTQFLANWPTVEQQTAAIRAGRQAAVDKLGAALQGRTVIQALVEADGAFGQTILDAGFTAFDETTRAVVGEQARQIHERQALQAGLEQQKVRAMLAAQLNVMPGDLNAARLWGYLGDRKNADTYLQEMGKQKVDTVGLTPERVVQLAQAQQEQTLLEQALQRTVEAKGGLMGMGGRMTWLVIISMLVCVVGISNAMLMSVTERFREIATLKCLGALDGFIMGLFVIEASVLGLVGGVIGALAGSLIGFGRMGAAFGGLLFGAFPTLPWLAALGIALVVGMGLAAVAGVYPSYMAARLAPMEAMRIE